MFRFAAAVRHDDAVEEWLASEPAAQFAVARHWFAQLRACGADVKELLHDGGAVACVNDAAFAYVNVHKRHVNVGFYTGASLPDPAGLLEGSGIRMRHVKVRAGHDINKKALAALIASAYRDVKARL